MADYKTLSQTLMEVDEIEMSKRYPETLFVTLVQNGATIMMPVEQLLKMYLLEDKHATAD